MQMGFQQGPDLLESRGGTAEGAFELVEYCMPRFGDRSRYTVCEVPDRTC
jgi:hypothetical protein